MSSPARTPHLRPTELAILRLLATHVYLTTDQLSFAIEMTAANLRHYLPVLEREKYIGYGFLPRGTAGGSAPRYFFIDERARRHAQEFQLNLPQRVAHKNSGRNLLHLDHTLRINDFLLSAYLLCKHNPDYGIDELFHERYFKRNYHSFEIPARRRTGQQTRSLQPDSYIKMIHYPTQMITPIALEIDQGDSTGGERETSWRDKINAYVQWYLGPYSQDMGRKSLTVAVVATKGSKRAHDLKRWTEAELTEMGQTQLADMFMFLLGNSMDFSVFDLFLMPIWLTACSDRPVALLENE